MTTLALLEGTRLAHGRCTAQEPRKSSVECEAVLEKAARTNTGGTGNRHVFNEHCTSCQQEAKLRVKRETKDHIGKKKRLRPGIHKVSEMDLQCSQSQSETVTALSGGHWCCIGSMA